MTTKVVFLLDLLLELINSLVDNSKELVISFKESEIDLVLDEIVTSSDYEQLSHTRIPKMIQMIKKKLIN